jgi:hypothetical protein
MRKWNPPMLTHSIILAGSDAVKGYMLKEIAARLDEVFESLIDADVHAAETACRLFAQAAGQTLLGSVLALKAFRVSCAEIAAAGLSPDDVRWRIDQDYRIKMNSTLGPIDVPGSAWRSGSDGRGTTRRAGLDAVHPLRGACASTPCLLEWECRFAHRMPYQQAAKELMWATDNGADIEDTRMAAHAVAIGSMIDRTFLYKTPKDIKDILTHLATCGRGSGPILYVSTDATALRRFTDETTKGSWKMANGIRLWCINRFTGDTIHIGGEYTWGDCETVIEALTDLDLRKILPRDGNYGHDCQAEICVISDGSSWIRDRFQAWFAAPVGILDVWHLVERLNQDAKTMFGDGTPQMKQFMSRVSCEIFGPSSTRSSDAAKLRRGRKNGKRTSPKPLPLGRSPSREAGVELIALVTCASIRQGTEQVRDTLLNFLAANLERINYRRFKWLGFCIGSGAMESLHRTGVQCRLKLPGAVWTPEASTAQFNLRMVTIADRWRAFWSDPGMPDLLRKAFPKAHRPEVSRAA